MAKVYKVLVTTTYVTERIVVAESDEQVEKWIGDGDAFKGIDLLDDVPDVKAEFYERSDYAESEADVNLTTKGE